MVCLHFHHQQICLDSIACHADVRLQIRGLPIPAFGALPVQEGLQCFDAVARSLGQNASLMLTFERIGIVQRPFKLLVQAGNAAPSRWQICCQADPAD